jgi:hypothetical protein
VKAASPSGAISPEAVIGIVSLIFWSLIIVILNTRPSSCAQAIMARAAFWPFSP